MKKKKNKETGGKAFDLGLIRRIFSYTKPYRGKFYSALLITLLLSALSIARPIIIQQIIDKYIVQKDAHMLLIMTCVLLATLATEAVLQFSNIFITSFIGQSIIRDLRSRVYQHILSFRTKYFDNTPIGTLVTRAVSDIESLADVFSQGFIVIMGDILTLVVFIVTMFIVNWQLALIVLTTIPLLLVATNMFKNGVKSSFTEVRNAVAALNTFVQEHIQGMKIVQVFNREEAEYKKFEVINDRHKKANIRSIWFYSIFFPVVEILSSIAIGLLIWYAGVRLGKISITAGEITFFIMLTNMLFRPIRMLADRLNTLQMGMVASERVFKVLDTEDHIANTGVLSSSGIRGDIEFRNVWFAYNDEDYVLKNISFTVRQGETIALVGATGAGKSSVINLLSRFYEYNDGEIQIDGKNIRDYELHELRERVGIVLQDVFLFSDSVLNNITLHHEGITREEVIEAAKAVGAHDFIMALPGNYDYNVKERGATLSVGQRQLISFIRAYVFRPAVLILDEATSSIDTETEMLIQEATEHITKGRTSIIIAHRLATIQKADRIIVLDKGEIIESGTIQELLSQKGQFKRLYELQFVEN